MLRKLYGMLRPRERVRIPILVALAIVMAVIEVAGIGSIAWFATLIADPTVVESNRWLNRAYATLEFSDHRAFLIAVGTVLVGVVVVRNLFGMFCLWYRLRYLHWLRVRLAARLLRGYMARAYSFFLGANSAHLSKNLLVDTNTLINGYLYSWITLVTDGVMSGAIIGFLIWQEPFVTLIALSCFGLIGIVLAWGMKRKLQELGRRHRALNDSLFKTVNESFGGIKEIKVLGRESFFVSAFTAVAREHARVAIVFMLLTDAPRFVLEILAVGAIMVVVFVALGEARDISAIAGILVLFGFATYRLLPIVHRMVSCIGGLRFNESVLAGLHEAVVAAEAEGVWTAAPGRQLAFHREIVLDRVGFRYPRATIDALQDITLRIPSRSVVAIVGRTGAGKTTLVDLILGLLAPTSGTLSVDGLPIEGANVRDWQRNIAYVPQEIYLADNTISANITLGLELDKVDQARVEAVARTAHLHEFVETLADRYDTPVGERGVRLSGGQRQRIGIARAVYRGAELLVLDEATSSLDGITEKMIEEGIRSLTGRVSVIIIAHRLTTVRRCDKIYLLDQGRIIDSGTYDELMRGNEIFQDMARATA